MLLNDMPVHFELAGIFYLLYVMLCAILYHLYNMYKSFIRKQFFVERICTALITDFYIFTVNLIRYGTVIMFCYIINLTRSRLYLRGSYIEISNWSTFSIAILFGPFKYEIVNRI